MNDPDPEIPSFEDLAADPEIAALLDFVPVARKIKRPDGWFPDLQRELIARIAATGTVQAAVWQMGKHATGAEALYKTPGADSFRASWDSAVKIGRRRNGLDSRPPWGGEVPGITRRKPRPPSRAREGSGVGQPARGLDTALPTEAAIHEDLTRALFKKFLLKLRQERNARLAGRIAEADFYARQIAFFEVALELKHPAGIDALEELRRDGFDVIDIAETDRTHILDRLRRKAWLEWELERINKSKSSPSSLGAGDHAKHGGGASDGERCGEDLLAYEPDDDDPFDLFPRHLLKDHPSAEPGQGFRSEPLPCLGPCKHPAEGYTEEQWAALGEHERKRVYEDQYARAAAEEQVKWEAEMLHWVERSRAGKLGEEYD